MKNLLQGLLLFFSCLSVAQYNKYWEGFFSYQTITDISQTDHQLFTATQNSYFTHNPTTNQITTTTTIDGLSGQPITKLLYSPAYQKTIIGHTTGLITIVNEKDKKAQQIVDIANKAIIPEGKRKINHLTENNGKIYLATGFAITVLDLQTGALLDTYFVGPAGSSIEVLQTTIYDNYIYAVTKDYGILKASLSNPNLIDFNQWQLVQPGSWSHITATKAQIIITNFSGELYTLNTNNTITFIKTYGQSLVDLKYINNTLLLTTPNNIYLIDDSLQEILTVNNASDPTISFTTASIVANNLYLGTKAHGLLQTLKNNATTLTNKSPNGLFTNNVFAIKNTPRYSWVAYGDYNDGYNPYPLDYLPLSKLNTNNQWELYPYATLLGAKSIVDILPNPANDDKVYFGSFYSGLLEIDNNTPSVLYNSSNSSLTTLEGQVPGDIRISGLAFDNANNLWVANSRVTNNLHVLRTNKTWQSYNLPCLQNPKDNSIKKIIVDKNNTKWITTNRNGLIAFNENKNAKCIALTEETQGGSLPSKDVRAIALDKKNKLWIGTKKGLRVLPTVDAFINKEELKANAVIILEDNTPQELLYQQFITDIVVDGANNKWIGTIDSGAFYLSSDGQKTIHHFTTTNSPLPSNTITDIDINETTGEVFFATQGGMVAFKGGVTAGVSTLDAVVVYPNPVRPDFNDNVSITGLMDNATIKITDITGNLVFEQVAKGGTVLWDTRIFGNQKVASGVYLVLITADDGTQTQVNKIMIIR